jgi:predicted deacetylase
VSIIARSRLLLASIHDVSPVFESEVDALVDRLVPRVGHRFAMLVVPNHWHRAPLLAGSGFAARLRAWSDAGVEMFLHGYFHRQEVLAPTLSDRFRGRWMTAGEGEFLALDRGEAGRRIDAGRKLVEDIIGRPVTGFVAPAWLYGDGALEALAAAGVGIVEDHWKVWSAGSGRILARGSVVTWASRTRLRLLSSLLAAPVVRHLPLRVLRLGVHPPDVHQPALLESIDATLAYALKHRRAGAYSELLPGSPTGTVASGY